MAGEFIIGHNKNTLVNSTFTADSGGTVDFGTFPAYRYSRFIGLFSVVGSFTFRYQMGVDSGTYQVSSTTTVNSGGSIVDVLNFGRQVNFGFTAVVSSEPRVYVAGEPIR